MVRSIIGAQPWIIKVRSGCWRSQSWIVVSVGVLEVGVSVAGSMHTGSIIDVRTRVDIILRVTGQVVILIVGWRNHCCGGSVDILVTWLIWIILIFSLGRIIVGWWSIFIL